MWEFNHTEELSHASHKYIAKIGEGVKAKYFYTQEALNAYKKALSSKDERAELGKALNGPGVAKVDIKDPRTGTVVGSATTITGKENVKRVVDAAEAYDKANTIEGKAEAVSKVFNERNPEVAKKLKRGKDFVAGLFR